jgi:hypothetical protein
MFQGRSTFSLLETTSSGSGDHHEENDGGPLFIAAVISATICVVIAIYFTTKYIWMHLKNYNDPRLQRPIVRILLLIPVEYYSHDSSLEGRKKKRRPGHHSHSLQQHILDLCG